MRLADRPGRLVVPYSTERTEIVTEVASGERFYGDLARWWPLISPVEEYADEAAQIGDVLASASIPVREVLELGSGGGHNAAYLKARFALTLVDLSTEMLDISRRLNPECEHLPGDMRTVRLQRAFDAVFVHDAVDYMTSEGDLRQALDTVFLHCRPGGVAVLVPDATAETFLPGVDCGGSDAPDGERGARYLEWSWDPNPADTSTLTEYVFVLRDGTGPVQVVHETHRTGLFSRDVWRRLLAEVGFEVETVTEQTPEERTPRQFFVGRRPPREPVHVRCRSGEDG